MALSSHKWGFTGWISGKPGVRELLRLLWAVKELHAQGVTSEEEYSKLPLEERSKIWKAIPTFAEL